jgi:hypothetical protein
MLGQRRTRSGGQFEMDAGKKKGKKGVKGGEKIKS